MSCLSCKGNMKTQQLAEHLVGQSCVDCNGTSFTLSDYLYYLSRSESKDEDLARNDEDIVLDADTKSAMLCSCGQIMHKYRISHDSDRRIDYCSACQTVWLDQGEWEYLKSSQLHRRINNIFTDPYQRKIRLEGTKVALHKNYEKNLGVEDYNEIKRVRSWLDGNPNKAVLLDYLNVNDPYSIK